MNPALKILAVDDNPSITDAMPSIFAAPRYELTTANDGNRALEKLEAAPGAFDVIIVDQQMPQLSGVELVREIRERGIPTKIMVLSAHLSSEIREAYEQVGVDVLLSKPFVREELRVAVYLLARDSD
jgi:two-component system, OmpR family, alkaline phosphatase synthesis response regulator PhoP